MTDASDRADARAEEKAEMKAEDRAAVKAAAASKAGAVKAAKAPAPAKPYDAKAHYSVGDVASFGGVNYVCTKAGDGNAPPDSAYWKVQAVEPSGPIMSIPDLAAWIRHVTIHGGGLDGGQTQQVLGVLDSYGGEPTPREVTYVQMPVPPGPPPAPPTIGPQG